MPGTLAVVAALLATPAAAANPWLRPVPGGEPVRAFDFGGRSPFAGGQHRGVDLRASVGAEVRSACTGTVVFAGRTPGHGRTVSVRCGRRRVAYLPLRSTRVRRGQGVARGHRIGRVTAGHRGALHVGVRIEGRRFGYVDPLALFGRASRPPPAIPRAGPPSRRALPPPRLRVPSPAAPPAPAMAPWPVWLGMGLLVVGAVGTSTVTLRRRSRRRAPLAIRRPARG